MPNPMSFEKWKSCLRDDCQKQNKLAAFNLIGDDVLTMLWKSELEPTVKALTDGGTSAPEFPS